MAFCSRARTAAAGSEASRMSRRRSSLPMPASRGISRSEFRRKPSTFLASGKPDERPSSTSSSTRSPKAMTRTSASAASVCPAVSASVWRSPGPSTSKFSVLVLDEATSALDDATEAAVMHALDQLGEEGRTIIMIAHRMTTIARADIVVRLDNGRVVGDRQPFGTGRRRSAAARFLGCHALRQIPTNLPAHSVTANATRFSPTNSAKRILSWMSSEMKTPPAASARQISG